MNIILCTLLVQLCYTMPVDVVFTEWDLRCVLFILHLLCSPLTKEETNDKKNNVEIHTQFPVVCQVLTQLTPQAVSEIDSLLGNKPHSKKETRAWRKTTKKRRGEKDGDCAERRKRNARGGGEREEGCCAEEHRFFALLHNQLKPACLLQHCASSICAQPFCASLCILY